MKRIASALSVATVLGLSAATLFAQQDRPLSPPGTATAMVGGTWTKDARGNAAYEGGKWIEVEYSRPMLRQRANIFGSGADYGKTVKAGEAVWRAGANATTVLRTEVPLTFGGTTVPAGEYGVLVDLKGENDWTLILTSQPRQQAFDANNTTELIGATNYDPKYDVVRVPMTVGSLTAGLDQFTIFFRDVTAVGGTLTMAWDMTVATAPFTVAK